MVQGENDMGKQLKLVNKLNRRAKKVKTSMKQFDRYDKESRSEETMAKSPKAYQLARKIQRRLDRNFGIDAVGYEPKISKRVKAVSIERFDFGVSDFGMKLTLSAGIIADIGLRPGDIVRVLSGSLQAYYLKVVALTSSTVVRLEDVATFGSLESNVHCRFQLSDVKGSYK
jgi:hypothetical protein